MASKALDVQEHPRGGGGKSKNAQVEVRNRRVLGDIGNFVPAPVGEGKPQQISRPITRSFCSELLANAQAKAEKNNKKPFAEEVPGKDKIVTSSSDKELPKNRRRQLVASSKKNEKTFTSILSARSKAACGITKKPKDPVVDIDAADLDNELAAVEYIDDIYKFYKLTEKDGRVHSYMSSQPQINSKMRSILVDWLIEVHRKFDLMPESLYLTVNIVDRFLSLKVVPRKELQLVGISSMLIACKYEEIWAPEVDDFIAISDKAYVREEVLLMEKAILGKLEWYLTVPTPYVFLVRYVKASVPSDKEMENMTFLFAELGLMHYSIMINYCPSKLAASAVYSARCTLNKTPFWTETLKHHTGYSEDELMDCAKLLVSYHSGVAESKLKAVYRKFSDPSKGAVALLPTSKNLMP